MAKQMGVPNLGNDGLLFSSSCRIPSPGCKLLSCRRSIFGLAKNAKPVGLVFVPNMKRLGKSNCITVAAVPKNEAEIFLEEFKFKPSFDEYLKFMDSVVVDRDRSAIQNVDEYYTDENSLVENNKSESANEVGGEDVDLGGKSLKSNGVKNVNALKKGEVGENVAVHYSNGKPEPNHDKRWTKGKVGRIQQNMVSSDVVAMMPTAKKSCRTNIVSKKGESNINKIILERESFYKTKVPRNKPITDSSVMKLGSNGLSRLSIESKMYEADIKKHVSGSRERLDRRYQDGNKTEINNERQITYLNDIRKGFRDHNNNQIHSYPRLNRDSAEMDEVDSKDTEMPKRMIHDRVNVWKGVGHNTSLEYDKVKSSTPLFQADGVDNYFDNDRKAFKLFEVFTDVKGRPRVLRMEMEERIQKLAKQLNSADIDMPEWQFSKMMHSAEIRFTDHTILRVVQILGDLGNWRRVLQVVQWLQSRDRFKSYKSRYIYTTVINVLGKAKRPVEALNVFHTMRQDFSSYPDLAAYHCIAVTLGQAGYMKELFDVIDCMRALPTKKFKTGMIDKWDPRLEPDVVVYNAVLNACVQRKQWEGAFWVLQQLKQLQIQPSSTTYGLVMEVMFACGKYSLVHEFFRKVQKTSFPSTLNYKVLVNTLWREGKTDEAVLAVEEMERRGIVGSASLYYDLSRCLCSAGRCCEALQQVNKICKVAQKPLVVTFTGLIQTCLESGSVENGAFLFSEMQKFCSPNIVTCNIMLKAYIENKMFEEARNLFEKVLNGVHSISSVKDYKNSVVPDTYMFNTMLEAFVKENRWDDFENFFGQMLHHGYQFNPKRHVWMILEASRAGKVKSLDMAWHHLIRSGRKIPVAIIKERFRAKLQEDDVITALSCLARDQVHQLHAFSEKAWLDFLHGSDGCIKKGTLIRLFKEANALISQSDHPNPVYENLASSCREFFRDDVAVAASSAFADSSNKYLEDRCLKFDL